MKYKTWYNFKKALEENLGNFIPNELWLQVKPKNPLPWNESDLHTSLLLLSINKSGVGDFCIKSFRRHLNAVH